MFNRIAGGRSFGRHLVLAGVAAGSTLLGMSAAFAGSWPSDQMKADARQPATSPKAKSSNTPAIARFQLCTRPAISGPRPAAHRIGGRTREARPSSSLWVTCCTTRPTTTCDVALTLFQTACDAQYLGVPQARRHIASPPELRLRTWRTQYLWKRYGWRCRITLPGCCCARP